MIACAECQKPFVPYDGKHKFCSGSCSHKTWIRNNRAKNNSYMRAWRKANPAIAERYNAKKRRGWEEAVCKGCGETFRRKTSQLRYCSVKCRGKTRRNRPGEREKASARSKTYATNNKARVRAWYQGYYPSYVQKKMTVHPWITLIPGIRQRAKKNKIDFDLTPEWFEVRWTGRCELTDIPFSEPAKRVGYKNRNMSPSVDRIEPAGGYTQDNCRIILWALNSFKRDGSDADMYRIAAALMKPSLNVTCFLSLPA